ncbi:hypothetical protein ACFU7T_22200 [Streptomyces sp. NPDC057555]|uniref:hypothetical protein n=1 Tax=Streptomyces sp. NPDC057555 TaxID=3346166 RepID=UPI0036B06A55
MDERTRAEVERAEAALVEHYPRLVRLAYLVLPPSMGRHRKVLTAHGLVQRALPWRVPRRPAGALPAQRGPQDAGSGYELMRQRTLELALAYEQRQRPAVLLPTVPFVWGLRLLPRAGGADELALDQALSAVPAPVRAALGLWCLEGLEADAARAVLARAGVQDPEAAERAAGQLDQRTGAAALLGSAEFDPCTVQARPTDLLRRRQRVRATAVLAAVLAAGVAAVVLPGGRPADGPVPTAAGQALDPGRLLRAPDEQWARSSRMDFTAWPPRGRQAGDRALLQRALRVWAAPPAGTRIVAAADTSTRPPAAPPRLLYAGLIDNVRVVVFHDGERLVRYAEPEGTTPTLHFARVDNADLTSAGGLVIGRGNGWLRYLIAPWVADVATRDLLTPDARPHGLHLAPDGVTDRIPLPPADGAACGHWPVAEFRSSPRIDDRRSFLVTDLGDLAPVHLTYLAHPAAGGPGEATGGPALRSWARTACTLRSLRGTGVRSVNNWAYAAQDLPEGGGTATWVCNRADTWRGPGRVMVQFQPPAAGPADPGRVTGREAGTAVCGPFGRHVLSDVHWQAKSGKWYLLAAGSSEVAGIDVTGGARAAADAATLAAPAAQGAPAQVTGRLRDGRPLRALRP